MSYYEMMCVLDTKSSDDVSRVTNQVKNHLTGAQAEILADENLGVKRLAYQINDRNEASYALIQFSAEPTVISPLRKEMETETMVLRYLISKLKKKPEPISSFPTGQAEREHSSPANAADAPQQDQPEKSEEPAASEDADSVSGVTGDAEVDNATDASAEEAPSA